MHSNLIYISKIIVFFERSQSKNFSFCQGASAPRHPRQQDFRRKSQQRGRPTRPLGAVGMPLKGAVSAADWG